MLSAYTTLPFRILIKLYRYSFSFLFGRTCRYLPTCSEYADNALKKHGLWAGLWMSLARFWRCRPLGSKGFDPIPETIPENAFWWCPWRYGRWQ